MDSIDKIKYCKQTIRSGNKERISEVLSRYWKQKNENKTFELVKEVFEGVENKPSALVDKTLVK